MKFLAEFLSTFLLVLLGTGAIVLAEEYQLISHLGISLVFGLAVMFLILIFSKIASIQMNPAVTLTLFLKKELNARQTSFNILFQILGAISASLLLLILFPTNKNLGNTLPQESLLTAFSWEFGMSFLLMFIILILDKFKAKLFFSALVIGFIIFLEAYFGGPITGASMNPARSIGPSVVSLNYSYLWIYILAPISGMIFSFISFNLFLKNN